MQIVLYIVDENATLTFGFSAKINKIQIIKKMNFRGAIQKFMDKCKEINTNQWVRLKIYENIF